jgi:hypothetical protein
MRVFLLIGIALLAIMLLPADLLADNCSGGIDCFDTNTYRDVLIFVGSGATGLVVLLTPDENSEESGAMDSFVVPGETDSGDPGGTTSPPKDGPADLASEFEKVLFPGSQPKTPPDAGGPPPTPPPPAPPRPVVDLPLGGDPLSPRPTPPRVPDPR